MVPLEIYACFIVCCSTLQSFANACSVSNECTGTNEICSTTNLCECKAGFSRSTNGTCVTGEDTSSRTLYTVLVAVFTALILLVLFAVCIFILLRRKKAKCLFCIQPSDEEDEHLQMTNMKHKPCIRQILGEYNQQSQAQQADSSVTEDDFGRLIQSLREDTSVFLQMINEVKRKMNLLDDKNTTQGMQYKALIRDLSRVLRLLNTKPAKLKMPVDGVPLLLWAENALKRFEKTELKNPRMEKRVNEVGETSSNMKTRDALS